jgi:hypothetical protein
VKYNQNGEFCQGKGEKDQGWTKAVSLMPEMEYFGVEGIEDVGQILPRTSREGPVHIHLSTEVSDVSVPGMTSSLMQTPSTGNLETQRWKLDRHDSGDA